MFSELELYSLEDIKPSKNLPLLAPLKILNHAESDYSGVKIRLYKISWFGYGNPKMIKVKLVDREITKSHDLNATMSEK